MNMFLFLLDGLAVTVFGSVLALTFCGGLNTPKKRWISLVGILLILVCQGIICYIWSADVLQMLYPLVTHLPLALLLCVLTKKALWSVFSVFIAYLCCQLRRWFALLFVAMVGGSAAMQAAVQLVITVPLLWLLVRFAVPAVQRIGAYSAKQQVKFGIIPVLYYVFDYLTVIYTDLLVSGSPVVVEFMPFMCCGAYLVFLLFHADQEWKKFQLQQAQTILNMQIEQSVREIHALRESQALARQYRHDLRHHLQYISTCIGNGRSDQANDYIAAICREIETQKVSRFCDNEAMNLILSAFAGRAKENGISLVVHGESSAAQSKLTDSDLCVLLSNALENAIHACCPLVSAGAQCEISVTFYEKAGKFFLQVTNPYGEDVRFENGIPVSDRPGHGIGMQSICTIVERYQGVYAFGVRDGHFVLRLSL